MAREKKTHLTGVWDRLVWAWRLTVHADTLCGLAWRRPYDSRVFGQTVNWVSRPIDWPGTHRKFKVSTTVDPAGATCGNCRRSWKAKGQPDPEAAASDGLFG